MALTKFGFAGTVHLNDVRIFDNGEVPTFTTYQAADRYTLFYRMHGRQGGEGRVFVGITDDSDGILGADASLPMNKYWSVQTRLHLLDSRPERRLRGGQPGGLEPGHQPRLELEGTCTQVLHEPVPSVVRRGR